MSRLILVTIILGSLVSLIMITGKNNENQVKIVQLSIDHKIKTFDPAIAFNDDALSIMGQSLDTLYQYHYLKRPFEVIPNLASQMPIIRDDGKRYEIKIKKNIKYHDHPAFNGQTRYVVAQDFINQIKRLALRDIKSTGKWLFKGRLKGFDQFGNKKFKTTQDFLNAPISGLKALDDQTLIIDLVKPEPNMLNFLTMLFTVPIPAEVLLETNNDLSNTVVGTGPYLFKDIKDKYYYLERNTDFKIEKYPTTGDRIANTKELLNHSSENLPFIDVVIFRVASSDDEKWKLFLDKKLDILKIPNRYIMDSLNRNSDFNKILSEKGYRVYQFSKVASRWLGFNMKDSLVGKNKKIREAIAHTIDPEEYNSVVFNKSNFVSNSIYNPSIAGYRPSHANPYQVNLNTAKRLVEESGVAKKDLVLTYSTRGSSPSNMEEANFIKKHLAKIGIKVNIDVLEFSDFLKLGRAGKLQFFTDSWIYDYPDAENLVQLLTSQNYPGINKSAYSNKYFDELYRDLGKITDIDKRKKILYAMEDIVYEDLPWVMLTYASSYMIVNKKIDNFRKSYFIRNFIKYLNVHE